MRTRHAINNAAAAAVAAVAAVAAAAAAAAAASLQHLLLPSSFNKSQPSQRTLSVIDYTTITTTKYYKNVLIIVTLSRGRCKGTLRNQDSR